MPVNSKVIKGLFDAMPELKNLAKTATNPHFGNQYTPLSEFLDLVKPILRTHNLLLVQSTDVDAAHGTPILVTQIYAADDPADPLVSRYPLLTARNDAQSFAGAHTYARRYDLKGILGIGEADDDGEEAAASETLKKGKKKAKPSVAAEEAPMCKVHGVAMEKGRSGRWGHWLDDAHTQLCLDGKVEDKSKGK
jgi:hypothetical protein